MTITALKAAIGLIIARQAAHGNKEEQSGRFNVTAHTVASADSAKTEV